MAHRRGLVAVCAIVASIVAAGCASSHPSTRPTAASVTTDTAPAATITATTTTTIPGSDPSPGCAAPTGARPASGNVAHHVTIGGVVHRYFVSVPAAYSARRPTPLVLLFHGYGSDAAQMDDLTDLPTLGSARGMIVVTPDGPNNTWQLSGTGTDAAYIDTIVAKVSTSICVDRHRVYAAGFSQGAAFTIFYACARPDRIAAIATVAVDFQLGCKRPIPIEAFHGTDDPAVPYADGATGASLPGVKVRGTLLNMSDWARLDHCGTVPATRSIGTEITLKTWPDCGSGTAVELYTVEKGSHTWPGADPAASPLYTTRQISASKLLLAFFARHHRSGS